MENVIHTQSRWVLKGQICNLLTLTDVVPHLAAAPTQTGKREKMDLVKESDVNNKILSYFTHSTLHIYRSSSSE